MLRVLTLSSLFPDETRPRLGPFVERQTRELAAHPDVELRVVSPIGMPPWPLSLHPHYRALDRVPPFELRGGVNVIHPRFIHWPGTQGRFDAGAMARALLPVLKDMRKTFPFDVIDAEFFFPDGPAAVQLGKALGVPVSIKARGSDIHLWGRAPATGAQVIAAGQSAAGVLAVSGALKADMVAMGMPEDRISIHYTGVDLDRFAPLDRAREKAALGVAGPLVVSIGTLTERKGQNLLIAALPYLAHVTLVLIGQGPDRAKFQALAASKGVADRVRFTGSISHEEIARWLSAADAMALLSVSEGLANAWVEALACGTPIVITDVGGAREVVDRPEAGHLVAPDQSAIVAAIRNLIDHPRDPQSVRACAERFTWAANRDALYAHLKGLVTSQNLRA